MNILTALLIKGNIISIGRKTLGVLLGAVLSLLITEMTISTFEALSIGALIYMLYDIAKHILEILNAKRTTEKLNVTVVNSEKELEEVISKMNSCNKTGEGNDTTEQ